MKMTVKIEGGAQLARALSELPKRISRPVELRALRAAAEPMRAAIAALAPRSPFNKQHMADHIVIGAVNGWDLVRRGRENETVVEVGPAAGKSGNDFFYGYFQEYGTSHHQAHPFMRPAFDAEAQRCLDILMMKLWQAIARQVKSGNLAVSASAAPSVASENAA